MTAADAPAPRFGVLRTLGLISSEPADPPETAEAEWPDSDRDEEPEPDTAPLAPITVPVALPPADGPEPYLSDEAAQEPPRADAGPGRGPRSPRQDPAGPPSAAHHPGPARRRRRILHRLRLTSPLVCIPPAVMLGMYMLLLREAALADSEHARRQAEPPSPPGPAPGAGAALASTPQRPGPRSSISLTVSAISSTTSTRMPRSGPWATDGSAGAAFWCAKNPANLLRWRRSLGL